MSDRPSTPTVNERFVKIRSKLPISQTLHQGSAFQVRIPGEEFVYQLEVVKIEHTNNQDETEDVTYILKLQP